MIRPQLKNLVFVSVKILGDAVREVYGEALYKEIELLRLRMKKVRSAEASIVERELNAVYRKLSKTKTKDLRQIAKAFSLMLELINTCETAYRSYRLSDFKINSKKKPHSIVYVFTSHPTESRSQDFLKLLGRIEDLLIKGLETDLDSIREELLYLLRIAVRLDLANNKKPQVKDEMDHIFHYVLDPKILLEQIRLQKKGYFVNFRTWVGGDKDGHPMVGSATMLVSFNKSRKRFLEGIKTYLHDFEKEMLLIEEGDKISRELRSLLKSITEIGIVKKGDGKRVEKFKLKLKKLCDLTDRLKLTSPKLDDVERLVELYPALVLPLEIREDSELIRNAVKDVKEPIYKMLLTLKDVSSGINPKWYVRGFVISMCQTTEDMLAAVTLTRRALGSLLIPVIPFSSVHKSI